ncbi:unnamed protein product [Fraxinus pennsylvanica]|uniref:K Homology domain-containing protein n=1 Tax=Fraxinus pennsylvanica TaxID=56036 RepID=A0AAD1YMB4_9LAMI|nr:unnamed protein product [Fraxinus pennsylvanica]
MISDIAYKRNNGILGVVVKDYDSETLHSRTKPRYSGSRVGGGQHFVFGNHRRFVGGGWGVIGKSGSIIKAIRQHTVAWINVYKLIPGDEERIIEISDTRRRDPDGWMPAFSPAQEALWWWWEEAVVVVFKG